eukprot:jgi/Psemu1/303467/fgenesh1_kg.107_\
MGELEKRRHLWESEKEALLGNLQREFNVAFDNRRRDINGNIKWAGTPTGMTTNTVQRNNLHVDTNETPHSAPSQGHGHFPPQFSSQQQTNGPSPLSINSEIFFADNNKKTSIGKPTGRPGTTSTRDTTSYFASSRNHPDDSPSPIAMVSRVGSNDGSPTIVSRSYSDIDSVLRETEELVQSIL